MSDSIESSAWEERRKLDVNARNLMCEKCTNLRETAFDHECNMLGDPHNCDSCEKEIADGCGCCYQYYQVCYQCASENHL